MFGFSGGELLVVLVVAALVMGPKNVAQALYGLRKLLDVIRQWSAKLRQDSAFDLSSLGINPADVEKLKNLDLSQYDPRQMVREAVQEEMNAWIAATNGAAAAGKAAAAGATSAMQQAAVPFRADVADVMVSENPLASKSSTAMGNAYPAAPQSGASESGAPQAGSSESEVSDSGYEGSVPNSSAPASDSSYEMPNYLATPVLFTEAPSTLASSLPVAQPPISRLPVAQAPAASPSGGLTAPVSQPVTSRTPSSGQDASPTDKPDQTDHLDQLDQLDQTDQPDKPNQLDQLDQLGRSVSGGRGASSSDIIDDGPLDLHTILNRPELGGSR